MASNSTTRPVEVVAGVQTSADFTNQSTRHYVFSDKIRFKDGYPEKIGGWVSQNLSSKFPINGCARNIYSYVLSNTINYIVGTHQGLYHINQTNDLLNITPTIGSNVLNNVFSSYYGTISSDPFSSTSGSNVITVQDNSHRLLNGDIVSFSGSSAFNGIPAGELNSTFNVSNVTDNTYDVIVTTNATSSGSGGGSSVVRSTRIIGVSQNNTLRNGDNITVSSTSNSVGGIPNTEIDGVRRVQNVTSTSYDIVAGVLATSSELNAGGNTNIAFQLPDGMCDASIGAGYGLGQYGVGQYGVSKVSSSPQLPRVWSFDRFGNLVVLTAGSQTGLYSWDGLTTTIPTIVQNAPESINYSFVSNEIVVTFGASGVGNRIQWSDQGRLTEWSPTAENRAGQDDIEGASEFISHATVRDVSLLFTESQVYTFRYINRPFVWETKQLDPSRGLIARNARIVVNGIAYWMGRDNFYSYRGANVDIIPSNTTTQTTLLNEVFDNLNLEQRSKCFCWYNEKYSEIWWHYPSLASLECDRIARYNVREGTWTSDTMDRTAGEYPTVLGSFPMLIDSSNSFYQHENGSNDNGQPLPFRLDSPYFFTGSDTIYILGVIPDSTQVGDISVTVNSKSYPQDEVTQVALETIGQTTNKITFRTSARYYQYQISGNSLNQTWRGGAWAEEVQMGTPL